jgi:hydrogen peroxide-dependent heme synthase
MTNNIAHPPETIEGWYAAHRVYRIDRRAALASALQTDSIRRRLVHAVRRSAAEGTTVGWSIVAELVGGEGDFLVLHFRPTLDELIVAERHVSDDEVMSVLTSVYGFLSVTEAGLYHLTAALSRAAVARGGSIGDEQYMKELEERRAAELDNPHVQRRLFPTLPPDMPYVCFYPMSKRRVPDQNWYTLSLDERSRLMQGHGTTGRRYAGRIMQVITGAIGISAWEWGVTLFGRDPLDFKKLVTDMRFDEVSALYAEFGEFYVGRIVEN